MSPSFDLVQEILRCLEPPVGFTGVTNKAAIAAVRSVLDATTDITVAPEIELWRQRWMRIGLVMLEFVRCLARSRTCCCGLAVSHA